MKAQSAALLPAILLAVSCTAFTQGNDGYSRRSLYGLTGIQVIVEISLPPEIAGSVTDVELEVEAERTLKKAGISIFDQDKTIALPGRPKLYLRIRAVKSAKLPVHALFLEASVAQRASLERDSSISVEANTWSVYSMGVAENPDLRGILKGAVINAVGEFITGFREQNPGK